ncbi:hypothetical protein ARMSODRAFT_206019 [Armillaria solidipes]|uniref:Uncharacterized protein n=1 Tax=Armillaria solidipes TaxID=1076256 RepID=A0A2H3BVG7_9AGAR|nr:hypothetical protein ARMSODRAFT_206019 [Armillaria solidipes]
MFLTRRDAFFHQCRLSSLRYSRSTAPRSIHAVLTKVRHRQLGEVFFRSTHSSIPSPVHSRGPQSSYQPKHLVLRASPQLHASSHSSLCELHRLDTIKTDKHPATNNVYPAAKAPRLTFIRFSFFFAILTLSRMRDRFDSSTSADENIRLCGRATYVYRARTPLSRSTMCSGRRKQEHGWALEANSVGWVQAQELYVPPKQHYVSSLVYADVRIQSCSDESDLTRASLSSLFRLSGWSFSNPSSLRGDLKQTEAP